jgi:DNA repair protein RecO (recombination protein O)
VPEEVTATGIVLRRRDAGEADRRLTLLTSEHGRVEVVAKGARKPSSRFAAVTEPLARGRFTYVPGRRNKFLTQAQAAPSFRALRSDFDRLTYALALSELYAATIQEEDPSGAEALPLLERSLEEISSHPEPGIALVWAETKLLEWSGFQPSWLRGVESPQQLEQRDHWFSPAAGGLLADADAVRYSDRCQIYWQDAVALARLPELDAPPRTFARWASCLRALHPFWRHVVGGPVPAHEAICADLRLRARSAKAG